MNIKLLKTFIESAIDSIDVPLIESDGSNAIDFYCADVVGNKRFAQNYGCYPRSEIAEINAQANAQLQSSMLAELIDYSSNIDSKTAGLTDVEISLGHRSRYCQAPSEMQRWLESQLEIRDARRSKLPENSSGEDPIEFNVDDVKTSES